MASLQAPVKAPGKVSPTIKFMRWSLLFCGIIHGWNKRAVLEIRERKDRILRREAIERNNKLKAEETKKSYREMLIYFGEMVGVKFPSNWNPPE